MLLSLGLLTLVTVVLSFATGALQARVADQAWRLSAYDTKGVRRFALTLSTQHRPDIALFNERGQRWTP